MALRFIDSFDHYQTAQLTAKWSTVSLPGFISVGNGNGRCGTNCLRFVSGSIAYVEKGCPFSGLTVVVGLALFVEQQVNAESRFFDYNSGQAFGAQIYLVRGSDGSIKAYRNDTVPVLLGTSVPDVVRVGDWYYLESKFFCDPAAGSLEVHVNGVAVLTLAGIDTVANAVGAFADVNSFVLRCASNLIWRVDDLYALDTSGPAPNNDFLGDVRVEYLEPTGDGAHQDWSLIGAASHWQAVDDGATPDDDTTYIHTATVGQQDTEVYENTGLPAGTIFGLQIGVYARKTDSGFREVAPIIRHAGIDYLGSNQAPSFASYTYLIEVFETNPGTGAAWTISGVNDAEYGVKLTV